MTTISRPSVTDLWREQEINLITELMKCVVTVVPTDKPSLLGLVNILNIAVTKNNEVEARA